MAKMPTTDEWVEKIGNKAINEFVYNGKTLKEWIDLIVSRKLVILPEKPSNGDVIKALFLHKDIEIDEHKNYTQMYYTDSYITFPSSWWNAKYKVGDTDGNS